MSATVLHGSTTRLRLKGSDTVVYIEEVRYEHSTRPIFTADRFMPIGFIPQPQRYIIRGRTDCGGEITYEGDNPDEFFDPFERQPETLFDIITAHKAGLIKGSSVWLDVVAGGVYYDKRSESIPGCHPYCVGIGGPDRKTVVALLPVITDSDEDDYIGLSSKSHELKLDQMLYLGRVDALTVEVL